MTKPNDDKTNVNTAENQANQEAIYQALLLDLLDTLTLEDMGGDVYRGSSRDYVGARIFGGQVLAQALMASFQTVQHMPCHSLHSYFLRGGDIRYPVYYEVVKLRDGKSLSARQVTAVQYIEGSRQVIFVMMASFALPSAGLDYQEAMPNYPSADKVKTEQAMKAMYVDSVPEPLKERFMQERHITIRPINPKNPIAPEIDLPRQAMWLAIPALSYETVAVQQALLAFASDFYLVATGLIGHGLSLVHPKLQIASIDHSIHFHRPFELGSWLLYEMWSDTTSNDKSLNHGRFWQDGNLVASTQQQGLMRWRSDK